MLPVLLAGLALGLSLIIAIGAQNLFVLRQGMRSEHVLLVATVCAVSDVILIVAGVAGLGALVEAVPWLITAVRWAGAAFLIGYGLLAARRAWRPSGQALDARDGTPGPANGAADAAAEASAGRGTMTTAARPRSRSAVVLTVLALTWLNPHVYLDTVFLLGGVAATHGEDRWIFAVGAAIGSILWFFTLALGARHLGRWLRTPRAWRVLDAIIAVVMIALGVSLVLPGG